MGSRLINYPLIILIFGAVISNLSSITGVNSQLSVGLSYSFNILGIPISFSLGTEGILLLLVLCGAIGALAGITILGSGLSTMTQAIIYKSIFYYGLWGIFSALSITLLTSINIIGSVLWLCLTLFYVIGVQEQIGTHPS